MKNIYLDHCASTPLDPEVIKVMHAYHLETQANPSSLHNPGIDQRKLINTARKSIATMLHCAPDEILFTSGGTESINLAIKGLAFSNPNKKEIITTPIEHKATLETCKFLETIGYLVKFAQVDNHGNIDLNHLESLITDQTLLISIIWGNNEIGTIQDAKQIGKIARAHQVFLHVDAIQMVGQTDIDLSELGFDLMSLSAHKFYGPKGIGLLYIKKGVRLTPLFHGGGQEYKLRSGTEDVCGIIGLEKALSLVTLNIEKRQEKIKSLSEFFLEQLNKKYNVKLNGPNINKNRLVGLLNISFENINGFQLSFALNQLNVFASTGSACNASLIEPSHVLEAIKVDPKYISGTLRISFGYGQDASLVDELMFRFETALNTL